MLSPHQNHVPVTPFRLIPGPWCRGGRFSGNCSFLAAFCPFCRSHQLPVVNHQGGRRGPHLLMREATNWRLTWGTVARKSPGDDGGVMEDDGNRPNMIFTNAVDRMRMNISNEDCQQMQWRNRSLAGWVGRLIRASHPSDTPLAYWPNTSQEQSILSVIECARSNIDQIYTVWLLFPLKYV